MSPTRSPRTVVVTGDVTMDWNVLRSRSAGSDGASWNARDVARACWQRGGALLLADLVESIALDMGTGPRIEVRQPAVPREGVCPDDPRFHHSYAIWAPVPPHGAWRVEEFLGLDRRPPAGATADDRHIVVDGPIAADLVLLDDAGLGFRDRKDLWPRVLADGRRRPWVVLKMARPVAEGPLWRQLLDRSDRLVVVMTVDDLRQSEVQVSRELSWERTAQDLAWELAHNPRINALARAAYVVVSFGTSGAFLFSRPGRSELPRGRLLFDAEGIEGSWTLDQPGGMIGYTTCLSAGIARRILLAPNHPDVEAGIQEGIAAMRRLHRDGFQERGGTLVFPFESVVQTLATTERPLATADVQDPMRFLTKTAAGSRPVRGTWSILEDRYADRLEQVVQRVALEGIEKALPGTPLGRFGALVTVDRHEIESLRAIRALVAEYARGREAKPLSFAVFGAPGSGKSFGITQVARALLPGRMETMTFNLSQLGGPSDLHDALHLVRDTALSGKMPLVFWDEFDSALEREPLGWLRHFLAPMQDGAFQQGQVVHPVGRAIFVFAGGTSESMAGFGRDIPDEVFRAVKGPDFVSRLKGYVDVLGPNPRRGSPDPFYLLRRAILLRALLLKHHRPLFRDGRLTIDPGVLRAFLWTLRYRHGARSMESIVTTSLLAGKPSFERSSLPAESQLELHVDARDFLALVQRLDLDGEILERLARAAHQVYREGLARRGETAPAAALEYDALADDEKEQNRGLVRDIANKLAAAGYVMVSARSDEPPFDFPGPELDRLAEMEHDRWMRAKIAAGWRWAGTTDKGKGLHAALLLWGGRAADSGSERDDGAGPFTSEELAAIGADPLPESEKEKDRDIVRGIPMILAKAGYTVLRAGPDT
jgi:hypothetical protein